MNDKEKLRYALDKDPQMAQIMANKEKLSRLLSSDEGKKLIAFLGRDGGSALKKAAGAISSGDSAEAKRILQPLMEQPDAQKLVNELNRKANE